VGFGFDSSGLVPGSLVEALPRTIRLIQALESGIDPGAVDLAQVFSLSFLQQRARAAAGLSLKRPGCLQNRPVLPESGSRNALQQVDLLLFRFLDPIPQRCS